MGWFRRQARLCVREDPRGVNTFPRLDSLVKGHSPLVMFRHFAAAQQLDGADPPTCPKSALVLPARLA